MTHYYLLIKSDNKLLDQKWYESAQDFYTDLPLSIGEKALFDNCHNWQAEFTKDYGTKLFKVVDRINRIDDINNSDVVINSWVDIYLEPLKK